MATTPATTQERPNSTCTHSATKKAGESDGISMPATLIGVSVIMLTGLFYFRGDTFRSWQAMDRRIEDRTPLGSQFEQRETKRLIMINIRLTHIFFLSVLLTTYA